MSPWAEVPRTVLQARAPCVLHLRHAPVTIINEGHHPFPQAWQRSLWGKVADDRTVAVCATGHNSVHAALDAWAKVGEWPTWCRDRTRDLCDFAVVARRSALSGVTAPVFWPEWMGEPL